MAKLIGIRREDKNKWERRVPLIPEHIEDLERKFGIKTVIQPAPGRIFADAEFSSVGALVAEDTTAADINFAVKEIPVNYFQAEKTYIFFAHVIKGQSYNMAMLRRMMDLRVNLIDYEKIIDESGRRLIFFGKYAGLAGMVETLYSYRQKLSAARIDSPFDAIRQAYQYDSVEDAKRHFREVSEKISKDGFPEVLNPVVIGVAGYGNVARGAQEMLDLLPVIELTPAELLESYGRLNDRKHIFKVVFKEEHMVRPTSGDFELQDYYQHPEKYVGIFEQYLPKLTMLVNCIYWTEKYPRLVTRNYLINHTDDNFKLKVIGDISCDIDGSIEITNKVTYPDNASFTYLPREDHTVDGVLRDGVTVMAIDNLPCEFSREASAEFSNVLKEYVKPIADADFGKPYEELNLPYPIKKALILHRGELTPDYEYIRDFLK
ncbi:MAG: hypothetical protein ABIA75_00930 [Candidatus Neomarinimicrobiota bacterium]